VVFFAVEIEGVLKLVAGLAALAGDAADAGAGAIAEGTAQVVVEVHHGLE
jgi:hypothetical protein